MISFKIPCLLRFQKLNVDAIKYCQFHFFSPEDVFKVCSFEMYNKSDLFKLYILYSFASACCGFLSTLTV